MLEKQQKRYRRHRRVRAKIFGTVERPRLYVFRSAHHIYAQLINDEKGETILSSSDLKLKKAKTQIRGKEKVNRIGKIATAYEIGKLIAKKALEKKIEKVVFDKGGYKYHGRVKALAEGARDSGLKF